MKEIIFYAGESLDNAHAELQKYSKEHKESCFGVFNEIKIYSYESLDDAYKKVLGRDKTEFDERQQREQEEYEQREREFKARIPKLTAEYINKAEGLIRDSEMDFWRKIVPIRLNDIYHGMEMDATLEIAKLIRECSSAHIPLSEMKEKCYKKFLEQNHSGMSGNLTLHMIARFCPCGSSIVEEIQKNK